MQGMLVDAILILGLAHVILEAFQSSVRERDVNEDPLKNGGRSHPEKWIILLILDRLVAPRVHRLQLRDAIVQAMVPGK